MRWPGGVCRAGSCVKEVIEESTAIIKAGLTDSINVNSEEGRFTDSPSRRQLTTKPRTEYLKTIATWL